MSRERQLRWSDTSVEEESPDDMREAQSLVDEKATGDSESTS